MAVDWNKDGHCDLVMLDHEGFLVWFEQSSKGLFPGKRIFNGVENASRFDGNSKPQIGREGPLQLNVGIAGKSGRRKLALVDWDGDSNLDLLANSTSCDWFQGRPVAEGYLLKRVSPISDQKLAGHDTAPTTVDFDANGVPDLVLGAEDGRLYYLRR